MNEGSNEEREREKRTKAGEGGKRENGRKWETKSFVRSEGEPPLLG